MFLHSPFFYVYYIRMSKIINFFGGPGIGKSTQASGLFTEMKKHHMSVEYTYEFPKEVAWEGNVSQLRDQFFITCLLYTSPSPRDRTRSRMPSSA